MIAHDKHIMPALIIAFDGVLAYTLPLRAAAVKQALIHESATANTSAQVALSQPALTYTIDRAIAGRTLAEVITDATSEATSEALASSTDSRAQFSNDATFPMGLDATASELAALRAERLYSQSLAQGAAFNASVLEYLKAKATEGYKIVIRADSTRSQVEQQLSLAAIDHLVSFMRCGDDPISPHDTSTYSGNWRVIHEKLNSMRVSIDERTVVESRLQQQQLPNQHLSDTPDVLPRELTLHEVEAWTRAQDRAVWFESAIVWSRVYGAKALDVLNGLVTNDVALLTPGNGVYAAALAPKGKLICDMAVVCNDSENFSVATQRQVHRQWLDLTRKYVNPRLARISNEEDSLTTFAIVGPEAERAIADHIATSFGDAPTTPWSSISFEIDSIGAQLIRVPVLSTLPAFWLVVPSEHRELLASRLAGVLGEALSRAVSETLRIEAGWPAIGVDMDENTIPQEANLDTLNAISFNKGCYTGQETVARVHFRGHVNRYLRLLRSPVPLPRGSLLFDTAGKQVGEIRSTAISPSKGPLAIGMVRREVAAGSTLLAQCGEPSSAFTVVYV